MRFANNFMSSPDAQLEKLGGYAKRSERSKWAEEQELLIRDLAPFPSSYDVSQTQGTGFSEYTYTELLGGAWVATQSLEINCRLLDLASQYPDREQIDLSLLIGDKYQQSDDLGKFSGIKRVCFLPGHNAMDIASIELIGRLVHEEPDIMFKPHPITNEQAMSFIGARVGWNRVIPKDLSGNALLSQCDSVYTTSASEMAISGTILGKKVINVSNFFVEGSGAYHSISRLLFRAHAVSVEQAQLVLSSLISCPWSGIVIDQHIDTKNRFESYFAKTLELRELYRPLASPRGNPPQEKKG